MLSGHIHRAQRLSTDLSGRPLAAPVLYPGSTERTSFAEKGEAKGYLILDVDTGSGWGPRGKLAAARFRTLPTRPMVQIDLAGGGVPAAQLASTICERAQLLPLDAVLRIRLTGLLSDDALRVVSAGSLRCLLPRTMSASVALPDGAPRRKQAGRTGAGARESASEFIRNRQSKRQRLELGAGVGHLPFEQPCADRSESNGVPGPASRRHEV